MAHLVCLVFFLSGAAALAFETLWFRQAGLALGNSVWASSIVLSSFMAGLCLGNAVVARWGRLIRRPLAFYAKLEVLIAAGGLLLTLVLPWVGGLLAPLLGVLGEGAALDTARLGVAFVVLLAPATAMGATLPVLTKALFRIDPSFGAVLGKLYGWNTLGAVAGALAGDMLLIPALGIRGAAVAAAALGLTAAGSAALLARRGAAADPPVESGTVAASPALSTRAKRLLAAAALCGATLLAFEVVWFRFLQLFMTGTSSVFAIMLAVVLAGIGGGGLFASAWLRRRPGAHAVLPVVAFASGLAGVLAYLLFDPKSAGSGFGYYKDLWAVAHLAIWLMLPVSLLSGILFTLQGAALHAELAGSPDGETRAAGLLTFANTFGGIVGAAAGGFLLLPGLGIESSFFLLSAFYGAVAACLWTGGRATRRARAASVAVGASFLAALGSFPWVDRLNAHLQISSAPYEAADGSYTVAVAEGANCTVRCLRSDFLEVPLHHRLLTNGYSMSGSLVGSQRYMKLFVYLPVALRPNLKSALLIGYGVGQTAKALTDTRTLTEIHVADPAPEILAMSPVIFPGEGTDPLEDSRVTVHVEDGRFFLQTSERRFDLITGEPPPPKAAGIVSLYTRDYFQLLHDRLSDDGMVTYWLPGNSLTESDAKAITKAFSEVFDDASLWQGWGLDMMLVGSRNGGSPVRVSEEHFRRQWEDPVVAPELSALGIEVPEQLGATFLFDAAGLKTLLADTDPLTDDRPYRLSPTIVPMTLPWVELGPWLESGAAEAFAASSWVSAQWPTGLRERTIEWFPVQDALNDSFESVPPLSSVQRMLDRPEITTGTLWLLKSGARQQRIIARGARPPGSDLDVDYHEAARALAERRFRQAAGLFGRVSRQLPERRGPRLFRAYALCLAGDLPNARAVFAEAKRKRDTDPSWAWLAERFDL